MDEEGRRRRLLLLVYRRRSADIRQCSSSQRQQPGEALHARPTAALPMTRTRRHRGSTTVHQQQQQQQLDESGETETMRTSDALLLGSALLWRLLYCAALS